MDLFFNRIKIYAQNDYEPRGSYYPDDISGNPLGSDSTFSLLIIGVLLLIIGYFILTKTKSSWGLIGVIFMIIGFVCIAPAMTSLLGVALIVGVIGMVLFILYCIIKKN